MKNRYKYLVCAVSALAVAGLHADSISAAQSYPSDTPSASVTVRTGGKTTYVSPYIFGINDNGNISGTEPTVLKQCGAALSSYNWETNFSNTGSEGMNTNGIALIEKFPDTKWNDPALYTDNLITNAFLYGIPIRLVNLQLMGYTAKDAMGVVSETDEISDRWNRISFYKGDSYLNIPNTEDDVVYIDEYVGYLVNKYGTAAEGGINGYFLDSEPDKWNDNFPVLKLGGLDADELIENSLMLSAAVNVMDANALVFGPSVSGAAAAVDLGGNFDSGVTFIDYYLSGMRAGSVDEGTRLLDVLDIHYFISDEENSSDRARMQSVRSLWDEDYQGTGPLYRDYAAYMPVIPFLKGSADNYFPGTKISFSEYSFGGGNSISGCAAEADALGAFAENEIYLACLLPDKDGCAYQTAALNIYTDYDGRGSGFGNCLLESSSDDIMSSCYAARKDNDNSVITMVLINKNSYSEKKFSVVLESGAEYSSAAVYQVNNGSPQIVRPDDITDIENNSFEIALDPMTVCMLEIHGEDNTAAETTLVSETVTEKAGTESSVTVTSDRSEKTIEMITTGTGEEEITAPVTEMVTADTSAVTETQLTEYYEISEETDGDPGGDEEAEKEEETEERQVPAVIKIIISVLAVSCFAAVIYVIFFFK